MDKDIKNDILTEEEARKEIEKGWGKAENILEDEDKLGKFLLNLENKLKRIPKIGDKLSIVPVMMSLVRDYSIKKYKDIPLGSVIAILSALIYFVSPWDLIPDTIPILGLTDDVTVITVCWKMVESDLKEYIKWREENE